MKSFLPIFFLAFASFAIASPAYALQCTAQQTLCTAGGSQFCANGDANVCHAVGGEVVQGGGSDTTDQTPASPSSPTVTSPVPAQSSDTAGGSGNTGGFANPLKAGSITELISAVLHGIVQLGSILLVLALVYVGFLFVAAQGAEEKIRDARNALLWTVVGGLILLGAETIARVIGATVEAL